MSEKEYIVTLNRNVDHIKFDSEMIASTGAGAIPSRSTTIANARPGSKRNTHYMLTDSEAATLRSDPRVMAVEIPPEQRDDIELILNARQQGNFEKTTSDTGTFVNWGLRRMISKSNPYTGTTVAGDFTYTLDGSGVDVVIQDSGIQADHPEFQDAEGNSRVQEIDWYDESGLTGTQDPIFYTDLDGHGTHCAGIAAGKTYGWAKGARIYAQKLNGLEGATDPNNGIPIGDAFDCIKLWHNNKPIDPATGVKRPTIVNMSWGYVASYTTVSTINYRGVNYTGVQIDSTTERWNLGLVPYSSAGSFKTNVRIPSVDADIQEMIDAGIHICIAAGNRSHKIDLETGLDYNNFAETNAGTIYYHRGSSPSDDQAILVGNMDSEEHIDGLEQKAESSETGPGVDIYAPGTNIMSCTSDTNRFADGPYPDDNNFRICNISGTSMAAPQIAGLGAAYLQLKPDATPAELKAWLVSKSTTDTIFDTIDDEDYTKLRSLLGGNSRFAYNPFNRAVVFSITSS